MVVMCVRSSRSVRWVGDLGVLGRSLTSRAWSANGVIHPIRLSA